MFKDQIEICRFFLINAGAYVCSYSYFIELDSFLAIRNEICIYRCKIFLAHQSICLFVPSNIDSDLSISVNFYKTCQPDQDLKYSRLLWLIDWLMYVLIHILFWDHVIWDHVKKSSTELFTQWYYSAWSLRILIGKQDQLVCLKIKLKFADFSLLMQALMYALIHIL